MARSQIKKIGLFSLAALLLAVWSPFGGSTSDAKVLKFGTTIPLSGPAAPWGIQITRMMDMACGDINKAGGLKVGDTVYQLETVFYDCKGLPSEAAAMANRLVFKDKIKYIFGGVIAATGEAILPITTPEKVVTTSYWWGKKILSQKRPYSFRQTVSQYEIVPAFYDWINKNHPEIKTFAQIGPNDTSGWDTAAAIKESAKKAGMKLVAEEFFERGTKDMYPFLTRIVAKKPDLIDFGGCPPGDGAIAVKQLYELGYRGNKAWSCGTDPKLTIKLTGKACEGIWFSYGHDLEGPSATQQTKELARRYKAKYGDALTVAATIELAIVEIFTQAMKEAGTIDVDRVIQTIEKTKRFNTSYGPFVLTGKDYYGIDRQFVHFMMLGVAKGGKLVEVSPLPMPGLEK
ncbi:MAG: ABC transporter substrate-binding protein [Thermodesulfobacteriota bacterium]|nr:ABC transporter substrate-binding protein [Thermodesulfobacteriota bacterium]